MLGLDNNIIYFLLDQYENNWDIYFPFIRKNNWGIFKGLMRASFLLKKTDF